MKKGDRRERRAGIVGCELGELFGRGSRAICGGEAFRGVRPVHFPSLDADNYRERRGYGKDYEVAVSFPIEPHPVFEFDPVKVFVEDYGLALVRRGHAGKFRFARQARPVFGGVERAFPEKFFVHIARYS